MYTKKNRSSGDRSVVRQFVLGLLANFSSVGPSMSLGFSAIALPILGKSINSTQLSWFASVASLATPFGCYFAGPFADKYGRKTGLFCVNTVCLLGWIIIGVFCHLNQKHFWLLIIGRILTGLSTGLCSSPATVYMAEISSPELRGIFTTWASASFALGVLVIYFLGYLLQNNLGAICLVSALFPCIGLAITAFLIPESPTWLIGKNRIEIAHNNLYRILGKRVSSARVEAELEALIKSKGTIKNNTKKKPIFIQFYRKIRFLLQPHCLRPIGLVLTYFLFQQFSGIFVIIFYAIDIVSIADVSFDPYAIIVVIGAVRFFSALLPSFLSKRYGRRPLSLFSGTGMVLCLLPLSLYIKLKDDGTVNGENVSFIPLLLLLAYFVTSSIGFLPLPFALAAELFPTKIRGTAAGLISGTGYFFNFVAVKIYPDMVKFLGNSGVFCFYGVMACIGTIFVLVLLPETRGKSLKEIEEYFGKKPEVEDKKKLEEIL